MPDAEKRLLTEVERVELIGYFLRGSEGNVLVEKVERMIAARATAAENDTTFIGSTALLTALYDTYLEHVGITEPEGPDGPYIWCACRWRSDSFGSNDNPGDSYAVHLANAQHAAAVKALQPLVKRVMPSGTGDTDA